MWGERVQKALTEEVTGDSENAKEMRRQFMMEKWLGIAPKFADPMALAAQRGIKPRT